MRHIRSVLVLGVVVSAALLTGQGGTSVQAQQAGRRPRAVAGQLLVKYRPGAAIAQKERARGRARAAAIAHLRGDADAAAGGETELVDVPSDVPLGTAAAALQDDPDVLYAEPNWIYTHQACSGTCPTDPFFARQWALNNTAQVVDAHAGGANDADIDAPEAWSRVRGSSGVYVAVLDEGIDLHHEDLGTQPGGPIWTNPFDPADGRDNDGNGYVDDVHGWDFANGDSTVYDGGPGDPATDAHGTNVAGIIGAGTGNGIGMSGLSWDVTIIPVKFMTAAGGTTAGAVAAVDYIIDLKRRHGLNIVAINSSWSSAGFSQSLLDAITRAARHDILFITVAGNGGDDQIGDDNDRLPNYPASYDTTAGAGYDSVIAVAATNRFDGLEGWSNFGRSSVDLAAPGDLILTTAPQDGYTYASGTSMAAPHVTGAAVLVHAGRALSGAPLRAALLGQVDPLASLSGRTKTGGRLNVQRAVTPPPAPAPAAPEIVLHAKSATIAGAAWSIVADGTAAGGARLQNADRGAAKPAAAAAAPASFAELAFQAQAGVSYRLWIRGRASRDAWTNDSVFVQFDGAVTASGAPLYRTGTTAAATVNLEDCGGCGLLGWGWQDNGYGAGVLGPVVRFSRTGVQRLRIQAREDGLGLDQVVLSPAKYLQAAPGALKNDTTRLAAAGGAVISGGSAPAQGATDVVLYAAQATTVAGTWAVVADGTAAGGARLQNANAAAPKAVTAAATPVHYFEMTFTATAGVPYRLWIRGRATGNSYANDSVHVQFDRAVDQGGGARYRIGTTASAEVNLEDCSGCGVSGWGWQDNGYGAGVLGPPIYFAATGTQRIRVQVREDGLGIDQILLSPATFLSKSPGALKNDATILSR